MEIKKATRQGIKPLIVFYSESGCGKTFSALLLARGMVGLSGKIVGVDSESGRMSLYADVPEFGGYDTLDLEAPFTPDRYIQAHSAVIKSGADIVIYDSGSHEWEGVGGVLDMAAENEDRTKKAGLHNWKQPKFEHAKFVQTLIRSNIPVIVCLRAKYKSRQGKDERGKTVIIKDAFTSPIQADDFIFEATCHGEIMPNHSLRLTKWSHPSLKACFPDNAPIEKKHGEMIAKWCKGGAAESKAEPVDELKVAKSKLWAITKEIHGNDAAKLEKWLLDNTLLDPALSLSELDAKAVNSIIKLAEGKLKK